MMVNCPKCGFSQPQDQYCARCGVDMIAFRPARKPFLDRLVGSTSFQVVALILVVVTIFSFARHQRRLELAERNAEIENAQDSQVMVSRGTPSKSEFASSKLPAPPPQAPPAQKQLSAATAKPSLSQAAATGAQQPATAPSDQPASVPLAPTEDQAKPPVGAAKAPQNLQVTFAEVSRAFSNDLVSSADRRTGTFHGSFNSGVVSNLSQKIKSAQTANQWEVLDSTTRAMKANESLEFYGGQRDETSGQFLGFVVEAAATQIDENETNLRLRVFRYLRETNGSVEEFSVPMPETLSIPRSSGAFISGSFLLPRRQLSEADRRFYDPFKVLHVLVTEEFIRGVSDLVILIEPR